MDENVARTIRSIDKFSDLARFEKNAAEGNLLTEEIKDAIKNRSAELGRALIADRTGFDLTKLSPAEEAIVQAASEYAGVLKRQGKDASRTINQLRNRGLKNSAEISVARLAPTKGFTTLAEEGLGDLSYEQIVLNYPEEFSERAAWFARRRLVPPNDSARPPAAATSPIHERTETLLQWLSEQSASNGGRFPSFSNSDAAAVLGMTDMHKFGRVFGNIQSRLDFACYASGLPPLGLAAGSPFDKAWRQQDRHWAFPVKAMQAAARSHVWIGDDFDVVRKETKRLPGQAHLCWQNELAMNEEKVKAWAFSFKTSEPQESLTENEATRPSGRNPAWSRDELILALDLYLRFRGALPRKNHPELAELSAFLNTMFRGRIAGEKYRNSNGVYMKMMNFRRFDSDYTADGRVGLTKGNKEEELVWHEYSANPASLSAAVTAIRSKVEKGIRGGEEGRISTVIAEEPYWVFVCNPKKWAIDRFLDRNIEHDTWGIRPSDRQLFAPGQLAIIRVGVDRRTVAERNGRPLLEPGIYALCEVQSEAFDGTGAGDEFWAPEETREMGWPTVKIRYLRSYKTNPLTIDKLRADRPRLSHLLLNGFQASSFPLQADDFREVMQLLRVEPNDLPSPVTPSEITSHKLAEIEEKYLRASVEVKERLSRTVERGRTGALAKKAIGYKCQLCAALGLDPVGFATRNGEPYVEAHHVMPVAKKEVGSLAASNIMVLCANHHRQMHYGGINVVINATTFDFFVGKRAVAIYRLAVAVS